MSFVRPARRVLVAAVSLSALLAVAACGGSSDTPGGSPSGGTSGAAADFTQQGPVEFWAGKDTSANGNTQKLIDQFNASHPNGQVTFHELPDQADAQRQQMLLAHQSKNGKMGIISMDVVWTAEFAANGIVSALPAETFPTTGHLPATVDSGTYFNKLYGYPTSSDGGILYYRKDLLSKYNLQPPTTWDEMKAACKTIKDGENNDDLDCYTGQFQKYEGLTVNVAEAIDSSGGTIIGTDGKPTVNTAEAAKGLQYLADSFKDGTIPSEAITWQEEQGRKAFQDGNLIFLRNWPYVYANAAKTDGSSKVNGKFDVAALPGLTGPGVSSLGGHNFAIPTTADNKGTAADFVKFMGSEEAEKASALNASSAPTLESLYTDADVVKKYPYMPILLKSIQTAKPRPKAVQYGDVTLAIQDAAYPVLQGQGDATSALGTLQTRLGTLIK